MSKRIILHLDDNAKLLEGFAHLFRQSPLSAELEYVTCTTYNDFNTQVQNNAANLSCLIFDLVGHTPGKDELNEGNAEFLKILQESYANYNIPVFIYSGYLQQLSAKFENSGTVFKVDKKEGIDKVFQKIKLFHDSGFLSIFCPNGTLDTQIHKEMHQSFTRQFRPGEIEAIMESVDNKNLAEHKDRCTEIFKRIAVRSLMSDLLSTVVEDKSKVNPVEHFYRRISQVAYWTGDILESKADRAQIVVLTPRCDCSRKDNNADGILVCDVQNEFPNVKKADEIVRYLVDNIKERHLHYIPPSPLYTKGGKIDFKSHRTVSKAGLEADYQYLVSLSDDFANEILAKFSAFFLRTGISPIDPEEVLALLKKPDAKS